MVMNPKKQLPGALTTANQEFFDSLIRHQIGLLRLSGGIRNQVFALLDATEADISSKIRKTLANHKGFDSPASVRKMNTLLASIKATRLKAWRQVDEVWLKELTNLTLAEPIFVDGALKTTAPAVLQTTLPAPALLKTLVKVKPFEGKTLKQWSRNVAAADIARIDAQIKIGMVQGESSAAIARRIVGTVSQRGRNGVTEISRRNAAGITRTAITAISNQAKREFYLENTDIIKEEVYTATLDNRTTLICQSLDGKRFKPGDGPYPPLHFNCRSTRVAVLDGEVLGRRPARPATRSQMLKEFTKKNKLKSVTNRGQLPRGTKGKFDTFERARIRELTGTVPAKVTYQQWLGRQTVAFQNDVLGKTRATLFRKGDLKLDKFVNRAGDEIPLSQLAKTARKSFIAAGLDPEDFL